ncbi:MAG TPA: phenylacetic acid degradation bifunctional protein PaaZ [Ignavibacteriales bacterium]|nr:phenylacetic acid degradation bifunctional protein PaaZ [Ignavibacteriales bacterium]
MKLKSYSAGSWAGGAGSGTPLFNAVNGEFIAEAGSEGLDFKAMVDYARNVGGPNVRRLTFHQRAAMLKMLAVHLQTKKDVFYELSFASGATKFDAWVDIDGGFGTLYTYSGKGRRELPDKTFFLDGETESLSKGGTFVGRHICVPLEGVAVHINAFNFPCWGMLEKFAPTFLAGMPSIIKPATLTSYITEAIVREIINSGILPEGTLQLVCGSLGNMLDYLTGQDVVSITGSAATGRKLKQHPSIIDNAVRFNMESDSLNFSMLGLDATPDTQEFRLFIKEVVREMTIKSGQRCTAIRRVIVPEQWTEEAIDELKKSFAEIRIGDPRVDGVRMGPLAGQTQVEEVSRSVQELKKQAEVVLDGNASFAPVGKGTDKGAFFPPTILFSSNPLLQKAPHEIEAFGPVCTVMPYKALDDAIELAKMGRGSLVGSIFTADDGQAREIVMGTAAYHGRIMIVNSESAAESTGHGSPLPHLVHGGPGRAGGGEELGGIRAIFHYMQRTALQGSPTTLANITNVWIKGAKREEDMIHPFRKFFEEIEPGDCLYTHGRTITEADIVNFSGVSGDFFYAHSDITALEGSIFDGRCAHGYLVISAAAGLFVDPKRGPVLANYGIDELRFIQPVYVNDTIRVILTCREKISKDVKEGEIPQGVVKWDAEIINQRNEQVAQATILTLVKKKADVNPITI